MAAKHVQIQGTSRMNAGALSRFRGPLVTAVKNKSLIVELTRREIQGRYRGANFGLLWALISPF
ncbi:MAG TPA: hypothetical protein VN828_02250, partial [Acidobacteriaceae bacterium]|nr:hypothetical protein [Acidobacteriaceae bacterium]